MADVTVLMPVKVIVSDWFALALESLLAQTHRDLRILVLCSDESSDIAQIIQRMNDCRVEYVSCPQEDSITEQLNRGIELSETELIARADADDINEPWRLEWQVQFLHSHPSIHVVGTSLTIIDERGKIIGARSYPTTHGQIARTMHSYNALAHPTVMFRKSAVQQAGGYRHSGRPAQDYELWSRMIQQWHQVANLAEAGVRYRLHSASVKSRRQKQTIHSTLDVKRMYWHSSMTLGERCRYWGEHALLLMSPHIVQFAFSGIYFKAAGHQLIWGNSQTATAAMSAHQEATTVE